MTFPKLSPPNVLIGGPVRNSPVVSPVEPPLKACGNDGLWQCYQLQLRNKLRGIDPKEIKGSRHGRKFRLGDPVRVKVVRINPFRSEIEFELV
jgi:hypothetical protein